MAMFMVREITFAEAVDQIVILAEWTSPMLVVLNAVAMIVLSAKDTAIYGLDFFRQRIALYVACGEWRRSIWIAILFRILSIFCVDHRRRGG